MLTNQTFETKNITVKFDKEDNEVLVGIIVESRTFLLNAKQFKDLQEICKNTHFIFSDNNV